MKKSIWENQHLSLIMFFFFLGYTEKTLWNKQKDCGQLKKHVRIANFRGETWKKFHSLKIFVFLHGLMIWKVMRRNVWSDIVSWQTRRISNSTKYLLPAPMTTTSKKKKCNLLENCHIYALKLFWNACTWHELEDLIFYGQWISSHDRSQKWTEACDKLLNRLISYYSSHMWIQTVLLCG